MPEPDALLAELKVLRDGKWSAVYLGTKLKPLLPALIRRLEAQEQRIADLIIEDNLKVDADEACAQAAEATIDHLTQQLQASNARVSDLERRLAQAETALAVLQSESDGTIRDYRLQVEALAMERDDERRTKLETLYRAARAERERDAWQARVADAVVKLAIWMEALAGHHRALGVTDKECGRLQCIKARQALADAEATNG